MDLDWPDNPVSPLDEVVLFEVRSEDEAQRLWQRLQAERLSWLHRRGDGLFIAAVLRADPADLALLLREVEAWLVDCGLGEVQFELDGRRYSLQGPLAAMAGAAD